MRVATRSSARLTAAALALLLPLADSAGAAAAPSATSPSAPRRTFRIDFDNAPVVAAGESAGLQGCPVPKLHTQTGVGGKGRALALARGEDCSFPMRGNLDLAQGTLSFWVQPVDWNDGEGRSQVFFDVFGGASGEPFQLYVDSPPEPGTVRLVIAWGRDPHQRLFQIYAPAVWRAGTWQKVDLTWDAHDVVLYANGEPGERLPLDRITLPPLPDGRFRLAPRGADSNLIDEVEVWNTALPADRIRKRFLAESMPPLEETKLRVPHASEAALALDGQLQEGFWQHATRVPLLADAETGFAGLLVPHARFVWTPEALMVGIEASRTDLAPAASGTDLFELSVAKGPAGPVRSVSISPAGRAAEDTSGAVPIEVAAHAAGDAWTAEVRIPAAALGGSSFGPGEGLRFDLRHRPAAPGALGVGAYLGNARLVLAQEEEGVRVSSGAEAALGRAVVALDSAARTSAELSLWRGEEKVSQQTGSFTGRRTLETPLDPKPARLALDVRDADGEAVVHLETRVAPLDAPGLLPLPDVAQRRLDVAIDLSWLDGRWQKALASGAAKATLTDHGPRRVEGPLALTPADGRARVALASGFDAGAHELSLELHSAEGDLRVAREVEVPALPWVGTRVGQTEGVLDPWLPLGWDDDATVRVWGRRYRFDGPLLADVQGRGGPLLRGPMRLHARSGTVESVLRTTSSEVSSRSAARADFRGKGTLGADLDVEWSAWIEYDGLVVTTLELVPRKPGLRIDQLALDIPLEPRIARFLRGTSLRSTIHSGRVSWDGRRFESSFEPFVWLTNEDEGFLYFSESEANWVGADRPGAVVVRGGSDAGLELRLIDGPVTLPGRIRYQLGFQGTPVKPLLPDGRAWNFSEGGIPTPHETAIAYFSRFAKADGLWEMQRPLAIEAYDRELKERGIRPFYFGTTGATPDIDPTFRLFEPFWRSAWSMSYPENADPASTARDAVPAHRLAAVCPADPTFQDRMLYDADQLLRTLQAVGLYTDTDEVFADDNARHGCGFEDAFGKRGVTWTILKKRAFAKRLAAIVRSLPGRRYWMSHAHSRLVPPVHGFADFFYPGEELTTAVGRNPWFYMDQLDETAWHAEYRGESSGVVHVFLPEYFRSNGRREDILGPQPTESLLAMAAVNDVNVSSAWANPEAVGDYWGLRGSLGLVNAEFVGHWRPDCPVRAVEPEGLASVYKTRKGPVLVVTNRSPAERSISVEVRPAELGIGAGFAARDERSGRTLSVQGGRVVVPLPPRSYTYVSLVGG